MCLNLLTTVMTASVWFLNNKSFGVVQIHVETLSLILIATHMYTELVASEGHSKCYEADKISPEGHSKCYEADKIINTKYTSCII